MQVNHLPMLSRHGLRLRPLVRAVASILLAVSAALVVAFPLADRSEYAALFITLAPDVYAAQVSDVAGTTGEALVGVYEAP